MNIETRLRRVALLCAHFIRNLAYYRVGYDGKALKIGGDFWATVNGNFYDICILEWCKLFGDNNDPHSWAKVVEDQEQFYRELMDYLSTKDEEFSDYVRSIREYRDKFVAHLDSANKIILPHLGVAEQCVEFYYGHLLKLDKKLDFIGRLPGDIEEYRRMCNEEALEVYG